VKFLVFDAPAAGGGFEERIDFVKDMLARKTPLRFAQPHEHQRCKDLDCLRAELARVESLGGEGLMLRMPQSKYEAGRSVTLLKVKRFHDAEAIVTGHQDGAGKHKGRLGRVAREAPQRRNVLRRHRLQRPRALRPAVDRRDDHVPLPGTLRSWRPTLPQLRRRPH
jgi:DNA ligase-1